MGQNVDLWGDPIPDNWGKPGRPEHVATTDNANKIMVLLALDWDNQRIARALGISVPTLRKHYKFLVKARQGARARLEGAAMLALAGKAVGGDVQAIRELRRELDRADRQSQHAELVGAAPEATSPPARLVKQGKKEVRMAEAEAALEGVYAPGPAPTRLN